MTDTGSTPDLLWDIVRLGWKINGDGRLNDEGIGTMSAEKDELIVSIVGVNTRKIIQYLHSRVLELEEAKKEKP